MIGASGGLVSILTPSFNQSQWLNDNLLSVENQTYSNIEHIVMDGGSTDESVWVLESAGPNVRWWSEKDRGQSHALNKALAKSQGDIIGWINSDDAYVDRRAVQKAVETFALHPEVGVVYGDGLRVSKTNRMMHYIWAPPHADRVLPITSFLLQPSVFIRRSVLTQPMVNEELQFVMDRDLWWRLRGSTDFLKIPIVVGLDRFQPARKTLTEEYPHEARMYEKLHGINPDSKGRRCLGKTLSVGVRLAGTSGAAMTPRRVDCAINLDFGSLSNRILSQVIKPRRFMDAT